MTPSDKPREIAEKYFPTEERLSDYSLYNQLQQSNQDNLLSDLTALISEHYVPKDDYDKLGRLMDQLAEADEKQTSELLQQRDELREALKDAIGIIRTWHGMGVIDEAKEADMWRIYSSHAPEMKKLIAAIKNTETK